MEIPDVIVVNKADHPMTDTMVREVRGVLALSHDPEGWKVPILRTEAARGEGVEELAAKIDEHRAHIEAGGDAGRAPRPQPAQRGARDRHLADAPPARGDRRRGPRDRRPAGPGRAARARPGQRRRRAAGEGRPMAETTLPSLAEAMRWVGAEVDRPRRRRGRPRPRLLRRRRQRRAGLADRLPRPPPGEADRGAGRRLRAGRRPGLGRPRPRAAQLGAGGRPDAAAAARARADDLRPLRDRRAVGRAAEVAGRPEGSVTAMPPGG